jgi:dUTP diphosphatase
VTSIKILIKRLPGNSDLPLPTYQSEGAVGMDICAAVDGDLTIRKGEIVSIPCGFALAIPAGYEGQVRPRSGLAAKHGISVLNSPGTIDPDYRGEVRVVLINNGSLKFKITRGMRIAQLLVLPVPHVEWNEVEDLPATIRDAGGFGHTGQ